MLNTDLHLADLDQHMTRSQFVKNTLPTIRAMADAASDTIRQSQKQDRSHVPWDMPPTPNSLMHPASERPSADIHRSRSRLSKHPYSRQDSDFGHDGSPEGCNFLVNGPHEGSMKGWDAQVEQVLKEFYNSIRSERLPLHGANVLENERHRQQSNGSLAVSGLRRSPSVLSKAPSESYPLRGRQGDMRSATGRFSSKSRQRPRIYPSSTIGSSRTSLDDQSMWSPAASTWTKYSLGKTQTSLSVESFASWGGQASGYHQAIGFANALSQAIIREEAGAKDGTTPGSDGSDLGGRIVPLLEDETLELHGPPWAKEGILHHRHHIESVGKKNKNRNWSQCFAVIEKGQMRLFSFSGLNDHSRKNPLRHFRSHKSKTSNTSNGSAGHVVGGGNWTENADELGSFPLRQTIANLLPPPGFSKTKPHVWALSLPSGAVHLFSVGSAETGKEWAFTANYWSARLSKEPYVGGVSNIEYGWGENIVTSGLDSSSNSLASPPATGGLGSPAADMSDVSSPPPSASNAYRRPSFSHSRPPSSLGRSSFDQAPWASRIARLPGDKANISEWRPPASSMVSSVLMEVDQRKALQAYVDAVEDDLKKHNDLRSLMGSAVSYYFEFRKQQACSNSAQFSPRHPNAAKAMANWERKSAYLLKEIVKFRTYIEALNQAGVHKDKIYEERDQRKAEEEDHIEDPGADLEKDEDIEPGPLGNGEQEFKTEYSAPEEKPLLLSTAGTV
jgi:hypothetical protein